MNVARAQMQLGLIAEVAEVAVSLGIETWLRGGWAMDFYLGEITRDHEDVDWFAWVGDAAALKVGLRRNAFRRVPGSPDHQLDLRKHGLEVCFEFLDKDENGQVVVASGPWAGEPYPEAGAVSSQPGRIGLVECAILSPEAQIEIKQMMPIWVPRRPRRPKDAADIERLRAALIARRRPTAYERGGQ